MFEIRIFSFLKRCDVPLLCVILFSILFSFKAHSQCQTGLIEETDAIYEYSFTQVSSQVSEFNGLEFTSYIQANLPLCGATSLNGEGCFQIQLMNPTSPNIPGGNGYNYNDIGFSTAEFLMFTEEAWNTVNVETGLPLSEDSDGDGFVLDPVDDISGINNPYNIPVLEGVTGTFYIVVSYYCTDDISTGFDEESIVCQEEVIELVVNWPDELTASIDVINPVLCYGQSNGSMLISEVNGGTSPYTYSWYIDSSDGSGFDVDNDGVSEVLFSNDTDLINAPAGFYTFIITDSNGCEYIISNSNNELTQPDSLELFTVPTSIICNGDNNGFIDLTVTGGTGVYTYAWSNGADTEDISGLSAGSYSVTVTDENNCSSSTSVDITEPPILNIAETHSDYAGFGVSCNGASDGSIDITVTGGIGVYTYAWSNGADTEDVSGLSAGSYSVTVSDENDCSVSISVDITESDQISISNITSDYNGFNVSCNGASDGFIDITVTGGIGVYTYDWSNGAGTEDVSGLSAGSYSVTVTDENNCSSSISIDIAESEEMTISETHSDYAGFGVSCNGVSDGFIDITVTGGTGVYTYDWSNGADTEDLSNLSAGSYSVTVSDENDCSVSISVEIVETELPIISFETFPSSCFNTDDGFVEIVVSGGDSPPYSILGETQNLLPGLYSVIVLDSNDCENLVEFEITSPEPISFTTTSLVDCPPNISELVVTDLTAYGGVPPYNYAWFQLDTELVSGPDETILVVTEPGIYTLVVTDDIGCSVSQAISFDNSQVELDYEVTQTPCFNECNGSLIITPSGSFGDDWSLFYASNDIDGDGIPNINSNLNAADQDIDGDGIPNVDDPDIDGDGEYLNPDTDSDGLLNSVDPDIDGDGFNNEFDDDIDGDGVYIDCTGEDEDCENPDIDDDGVQNGFDTDVDGDGVDNEFDDDIDGDGVYDEDGDCVSNCNDDDDSPYGFVCISNCNYANNSSVDNDVYPDGIICVSNCNNDFSLAEDTDISPTAAVFSDYIEVFTTEITEDLNGNILNCDIDGDGIVNWEDPDVDGDGFINTDINEIDIDGDGVYDLDGNCIANCNGYAIYDNSNPPQCIQYCEDNDETPYGDVCFVYQVDGLCEGDYYAIAAEDFSNKDPVEDAGCESFLLEMSLPSYDEIIIDGPAIFNEDDDILCFGGTADIITDVSGGVPPYTYSWSTGQTTENLIGVTVGNYVLTITDSVGCEEEQLFIINEPNPIVITELHNNLLCFGDSDGSIDITVDGGIPPYTYSWSNGLDDEDISDLSAGLYTITVTDDNLCIETLSVEVVEPSDLLIESSVNTWPCGYEIQCFGANNGFVNITVSGGTTPYDYTWYVDSDGDGEYDDNNDDGEYDIYAITDDLTNVTPGSYSIFVEDGNGCLDSIVDIIFTEPDPLFVEATTSTTVCFSESEGFIDLTVSGGCVFTDYTFSWSGDLNNGTSYSSNLQNITDLLGGTYSVVVTDDNGCQYSIEDIVIEEYSEIIIELDEDDSFLNLDCFGDTTGVINVSVSGGSFPYVYSWSNGAETEDVSGLQAGSYVLTIVDNIGCVETYEVDVSEPLEILISEVNIDDNGCDEDPNGAIEIVVSGGVEPYEFLWSNGDITEDISNLSPGTYSVEVIDALGCVYIEDFVVGQLESPVITVVDVIDVLCYGDSTGVIDIQVDGGNPPYFYSWSNGLSTEDLSALVAGEYIITVYDMFGCNSSDTVNLFEPDSPISIIEIHEDLVCLGDTTGFIDITVTGGVEPYEFLWSNGEITEDIFNLSAGNYSVVITDSNLCVDTLEVSIDNPDQNIITSDVNNVSCFGFNDGFIDINISGPGTFSYLWNTGWDGQDLFDVGPGQYFVNITSDLGCGEQTLQFEIIEPDPIEVIVDDVQSSSCFSFTFNNGSIDITVIGGSGGYTYDWTKESDSSFQSSDEDLDELSAGFYSLIVTDSDGCVFEYPNQIQVTEPSPIEFFEDLDGNGVINSSFSFTEYVCANVCDGQISFDINAGVPPFYYELINDSGQLLFSTNNGLFNGLCSGCYTVNIYDANWDEETASECVTTVDICISESEPLISANIIPSGCGLDGLAEFEFPGGVAPYDVMLYLDNILYAEELNYSLDNFSYTNLPSGSYEFMVEDSVGCVDVFSFELENILNEMEIIDIEITNPECPNEFGFANIEFENSYNPDLFDPFGLISLAEDINGDCVLNPEETIIQSFTINNTFELNMSFDLENLSGGDYVVLIEDNFGCFVTACFSINTILEPNPDDFFASVDAICTEASGSAYVSLDPVDMGGTPPYDDPIWYYNDNGQIGLEIPSDFVSEDALIASSLYAGDYVVVITDANGCEFAHEFTIEEPESLLLSGISYSDVNCNSACDGEIIVQPYGGEGDYYTIIITPLGATSFPPEVLVAGLNDTYTYSGACAGDYEIEISDGVCPTIFENITIEEPAAINWTVVTNPLPCNGDVIIWSDPDVIGENYYVYSGDTGPADLYWFPNSQTCSNLNTSNALDINNLGSGNYYLYSIDANGCCTPQGQHLIPDTPVLESDFNPFDSELWIYCQGDNTGVLAFNTYGGTPSDGPYTYLWSFNGEYLPEYDNMNVVGDLGAGEYQVLVNDENGCGPITHNYVIEEPAPLSVSFNQSNYNSFGVSCFGESDGFIDLTVTGGLNPNNPNISYIYEWSGISFDGTPIDLSTQSNNQDLNNLPAGNYTFSVQVDIPDGESFISSCEYSALVVISEPSVLEVLGVNTSDLSCFESNDGAIDISVSGGAAPYTYLWSNGSTTEDLSDLAAGTYSLIVNDQNGCELVSDPIVVTEPNSFIANLPNNETVITNADCLFGDVDAVNSGQISIHLEDLFSQISGGTEPYGNLYLTYANGVFVQNGSVSGDSIFFTDLEGGEYDVHVVDALGCDLSFPVPVDINNNQLIDLDVEVEDADCGLNGSLFITSISNINGVPPYSITISSVSDPGFSYEFEVDGGFDYSSNDWNNNGIPDYDPDIDGDGYLNDEDGDMDGDGVSNYNDTTPYGEDGGDVDSDGVLNFDSDFIASDYGLYESAPPGEYEVFVVDAVGCVGNAGPFFINNNIPDFSVSMEAGNCYWALNNSCDPLSNNGSISIDPNSFTPNTIYPYSIFIDGDLYATIDDWGPMNSGLYDDYVIPNLEAGTAYSLALIDANGCSFTNNEDYYEVPFLSEFNVDIVGFCPECQESNNGGFAYTFLGISDEVLYGSNPSSYEIYSDPVNYGDNISIDILYNSNNIDDCLPDLDPDQLNVIQFDNDFLNYEDFYFIDDEWLGDIPDPNVLVDYHQEYLEVLEDTTDYVIGGLSYGTYYITMIDEYGCQFTEQIDISDENCKSEFGSQQWNNCLFIPSVFTPNADGINDFWDIYNIELYEPGVNVKIFNRWGQVVYENQDNEYSSNLWDGINMDGKNVEIATYYYVVEVDVDDEQKKYTGYVVVKR